MHGSSAVKMRAMILDLWSGSVMGNDRRGSITMEQAAPGNFPWTSSISSFKSALILVISTFISVRKVLDSLYINEECLESEEQKQKENNGSSNFGSFLSLLHNTIEFVGKTKVPKATKGKSIKKMKKKEEDARKSNMFLNQNIRLYLRVVLFCKRWRMKTETKNEDMDCQNLY